MAFSLCPLLTQGAIDMLEHHGSEEQQEQYLRPMVSGEWTGTMNLTEPQAGSDVGAITTKASPNDDGSWSIGATVGPLLASLLMSGGHDWSLFLFLAGVSGVLAAFTRYRMGRRIALPSAEQAKFAPRGEGTVAGTLDPRARPAKA